jgi:hypothetical protein
MARKNSRLLRCASALNPLKVARATGALWRDGRRASAASGVSMFRMAWEQAALHILDNLGRREYYVNALYDPALSWAQKRAFVGTRNTARYVGVLTPRRYEALFRNKIAFSRFFGAVGLPVPRLYGVFEPAWGRTADGTPLRTAADLARLVQEQGIKGFVLKPVESERGQMVLPLSRCAGGLVAPDGTTYTWDALVAHMTDKERLRKTYPDDAAPPRAFLVEERLRPHPDLCELTSETLCTVRVVTLVTLEGEAQVLGAVFRLPECDRGVDNLSQGGIAIPVVLETGTLGEGVFANAAPPVRHRTHPVSGKRFHGLRLPDWEAAMALARTAALAGPGDRLGRRAHHTGAGPGRGQQRFRSVGHPAGLSQGSVPGRVPAHIHGTDRPCRPGGSVAMAYRDTRLRRYASMLNPLKAARLAADLWRTGRAAASESGVSMLKIAREQTALYLLNNLNRREYYMYALQNPALSWEEKKAFISDKDSGRYTDLFTPRRYTALFKNKLAFNRIYGALGLPLAEQYGVYDPAWGRTADGGPFRSAQDIDRLLAARDLREFLIKPVESSQGRMVLPLKLSEGRWASPDGSLYSAEDLVAYMNDEERLREAYGPGGAPPRTFLFEERLRPHPAMRHFTVETLCSTRIVTLLTHRGEVEILGAAFKLPGVDRGVDNLSQGGLNIAVDLESGALMEGVFYKSVPPTRYRTHPSTGKDFYGFRLPLWDEVKETAARAALAFPLVRSIGWDIAATSRGPVVLEGNDSWAVEIPQQAYGRGLLQGSFRETYEALTRR